MSADPVCFLLVEDDDSHAELVQMALADNQVSNRVDRVNDGEQALAYLRREGHYADYPQPDVVILDLKLPKIDGHEVLAQLKTDHKLRAIPVVVLSTSAAKLDKAKAYYNHVNSYLVKPVGFGEFHQMIKDLARYWSVWNQRPCQLPATH